MLQRIEFAWNNFLTKRDKTKSYKRSPFRGPLVILLMIIAVLLLVLFMVFKITEGEESDLILEEYLTNVNDYGISKGDFQAIIEKAQEEIKTETPEAKDFSGVPIGSISINPGIPNNIKELNIQAYRVAAKYFNSSTVKYIPPEVADPLFFLALSNVEHEGYMDTTKMWSAAIPSRFMSDLTPNMVSDFGIQDTVNKYPDYWRVKRTSSMTFQGPLQMGIYYGVKEVMIPEDLKGNEGTRAGNIIQRLSPGSSAGKVTVPANVVTGDRLNWGDAVNRAAGYTDQMFAGYLKNNGISKEGDKSLQNRYSYLSLIAINHNTGVSVLHNSDGRPAGVWWKDAATARKLSHYLGNEDILSELDKMAQDNVNSYMNGGTLKGTLSTGESDKILRLIVSKGYMSEGEVYSTHFEKRNFPVKVLFSYLTLEKLYTGG